MEKVVTYKLEVDAMLEIHNQLSPFPIYAHLPAGALGTLVRSYGNYAYVLDFEGIEIIMTDIELEDKVFSLHSKETKEVIKRKHLTLIK